MGLGLVCCFGFCSYFWWFVLNCLVAAYSAFIVVYGLLLLVFGLGVVRLLGCLFVWFNVI